VIRPGDLHFASIQRRLLSRGEIEALALLAGLTCCLEGITVAWLVLDRQPPWWDDSFYLTKSLLMLDALVDGGVVEYVKRFFSIIPTRPPMITVLPTPIYLLLGRNPKYAFGVNLLFIPILLASVYLLGKQFWGVRAGLIAAYIVGTMPLIYGLVRSYLVEFNLTALVSLAVCLLMQSENFQRFRITLCFGIACGLGLLLKVTFPLFVLFPLLYVFLRFLQSTEPRANSRPASRLKTVSALVIPPVLLALPWYLWNFGPAIRLVEFAGFSQDADIYGTGRVFSFPAVEKYLLQVAGSGTSYYYVLLAVVLLALIFGARKADTFLQSFGKEPLAILLLWGLPFLVFLFGRNKNLRYVAPVLPAFGLVLAYTLDFMLQKMRRWQSVVLCLALMFPAVSVLQKSFFIFGDRMPRLNHFLCVNGPQDVARRYERPKWPQEDILNRLLQQKRVVPGKMETVMLGTDRAFFNADNFRLAALSENLPFDVYTSAHTPDLHDLLHTLDSTDFFIYKEGGEPESPFYNKNQGALVGEVEHSGKFTELPYHWRLPDGGRVRIFENVSAGWSVMKEGFIPSGVEPILRCDANFDNQIELTGLGVEESEKVLRVKLRWLCLKPPNRDYWCFFHVLDGKGQTIGNLDHPILGGEPPMESWKEGDVGIEELEFHVPAAEAHQGLRLSLGLYDVVSGERLLIRSFSLPGTARGTLAENDTALIISPLAAADHE
jgi:4-amino-4-deoxy-L-arabinose transferase-like glycosyltransferase